MSHGFGKKLLIGGAVLALFCALTWWLLHFRIEYAGSRIPSDLGDPVLVLYFMEWGAECLARGLRGYLDFWNGLFFFPAQEVMTFSDHVLGPALQASLLHRVGVNEVGGYNFAFLGSFVLCGLTTTWVLRRAGIGLAAAILGGIMFAFSPYRSDQRPHLQVLLMQWIPLVLWLWHRLLEEPRPRRAVAFALVYALHVTGGMYLGYFVHFALAILLLQHLDRWRALTSPRSLRVLVPTLAVCAALAAALFAPYLIARRTYELERGLGHVSYYGATLLSYFAVDADNEVWGQILRPLARPENQLFAGLVATVLAIVGVRLLWRRPRVELARVGGQAMRRILPGQLDRLANSRRRAVLAALFVVAVGGFMLGDVNTLVTAEKLDRSWIPGRLLGLMPAAALAIGGGLAWLLLFRRWHGEWPFLPPRATSSRWERGLIVIGLFFVLLALPVVFAALRRVVPGLDGLRVPTRAYPFASFALVFFAARGLDLWLQRMAVGRRRAVVAAVSVLLVLELRDSMDWHRWPNRDQIPGVFERIASVPNVGAVLNLPIPPYPREAHYMYYSIAHWRPIVNGFSGYEPPVYLEVKQRVRHRLFDPSTLDYLSEIGVTHVAVHPFLFKLPRERRQLLRWERRFGEGPGARLRPVFAEQRSRLWELLPPNRGAAVATESGR